MAVHLGDATAIAKLAMQVVQVETSDVRHVPAQQTVVQIRVVPWDDDIGYRCDPIVGEVVRLIA